MNEKKIKLNYNMKYLKPILVRESQKNNSFQNKLFYFCSFVN